MKNISKFKTIKKSLTVLALVLLATITSSTPNTHADSNETGIGGNHKGVTLRSDNVFYVYTAAGDQLDVTFRKIFSTNPNGNGYATASIKLTKPDGTSTTKTIAPGSYDNMDAGSPLTAQWLAQTSSTAGVWKVEFDIVETDDRVTYYDWNITPKAFNVGIPGRVWVERYNMSQSLADGSSLQNYFDGWSPEATMDFYYQSKEGYLYRATYKDYYGIDSVLGGSNFGLTEETAGNECKSIYKSITVASPTAANLDNRLSKNQPCGGIYKLFFQSPANDLPEASGNDWIKPATPSDPTIENLEFVQNNSDSMEGNLKFDVNGYTGPLLVQIDTNNDGDYTDENDVTIDQVKTSSNSGIETAWDGKDGLGDSVDSQQKVNFKVSITKTAEIHISMVDVEQLGGLVLQRVGGDDKVYWDDSSLASEPTCSTTPNLSGLSGVASGAGVHGWGADGSCNPTNGNANTGHTTNPGSWGDSRIIENWAFVPTDINKVLSFEPTVPPKEEPLIPMIPKTGIIGGLAGMLIAGSAAGGLLYAKERKAKLNKKTSSEK